MCRNILYFSSLVILTSIVNCKEPLYVGALLELSNNWYSEFAKFFVTIWEYAFEEIENRTDILADYSLQLVKKDTQGEGGMAARTLFELMTGDYPIVCVLGPSLSHEMIVVGQITPYYDVMQISYVSTTASTVDRDTYSTLFRVNHIRDNLNPLRIKIMRYFDWTRVGTIFVQNDIDGPDMAHFHDILSQHNMTLVTSAAIPDDDTAEISYVLARLKQYDARIIMASIFGTRGAKIFCEAYKMGLYGSNHVWILAGSGLYPGWIRLSIPLLKRYNCTLDELLTATEGYLSLKQELVSSRDTKTITGKKPTEITAILKSKRVETNGKMSQFYAWAYDAAWAMAIGLNNTLEHLNDSRLDNYTNNPFYLDAILKGMRDVSFEGLSGQVSFNEFGGRIGITYIEQNFNGTSKTVAMYNEMTDNLTWFVPVNRLWPDGIIPRDSFIYRRIVAAPSIPSLVLVLMGNTMCTIIALGFLAFNIYYRNNSQIKLSSPKINNIMIVGSIMLFVGVYISSLDYGHLLSDQLENATNICMVRVWIMCLGFTSLFGALFSKTWRVHRIFRAYSLKKKIIKDYHLYGVIAVLLLCDCIVLVPWSLTHSLHKNSVVITSKDFLNTSVIISEVYTYCHHHYATYWFVSIYIYKGLLLVFGVFLAWETRHVTVPALNDSKYIGFCIYNVVIICVFGVPLAHVLPIEQTTLNFVLLSTLIMFCTTLCLCILFIPKTKLRNQISERFLNPSLNSTTMNKPVMSNFSMNSRTRGRESSAVIDDMKSKETSGEYNTVEELKEENNCLRMRIASETIALVRLKRDILRVTGNIHFYKVGEKYIVFKADEDGSHVEETNESNRHNGAAEKDNTC